MTEAASAEPGATDLTYEEESKRRIQNWDTELQRLVAKRDSATLQTLKAEIDAQLALAELRIKIRQADWAKTMTWGPLMFPFLGAILGAFIGAWLKR